MNLSIEMLACVRVSVYVRASVYVCVSVYVHASVYVRVSVYVRASVYVRVSVYACVCGCVYVCEDEDARLPPIGTLSHLIQWFLSVDTPPLSLHACLVAEVSLHSAGAARGDSPAARGRVMFAMPEA